MIDVHLSPLLFYPTFPLLTNYHSERSPHRYTHRCWICRLGKHRSGGRGADCPERHSGPIRRQTQDGLCSSTQSS
jgi:hypothetical protein